MVFKLVTMNKSDLIAGLVRDFNLEESDAKLIVNQIFDSMTDSLVNGNRVEIRGFGSFEVRSYKARNGRNPKTGMMLKIDAKKAPFFKVGKGLKEFIDQ